MASSLGSGLTRRPAAGGGAQPKQLPCGTIRPDIDLPPRSPPLVFQLAGVGLILFLACLQFLPATHVRHPADRHRTWIPVNLNRTSSEITAVSRIDVFSWMSCLDLRMLAVLVNSTLSNSRYREHINFQFIIPQGEDKKLSYYKLKVLFPDSNIKIIGQIELQEVLMRVDKADINPSLLYFVTPLVIPSINPSVRKCMYISPDTIVEANIEELFEMDFGPYAIAVAEDCSTRLRDHVSGDVLSAIQRTAAKSWIPKEPYNRDTCLVDFRVILLDSSKLPRYTIEAILWWIKVLDLKLERESHIKLAISLSLYGKYSKLPSAWKVPDSLSSKLINERKVVLFDGPRGTCSSEQQTDHPGSDVRKIWKKFLGPKSDAILSHEN